MTIELPQELIEEILDHMDFESLKSGSLVCRAWVFRARSHLFHKITLLPDIVVVFRDLLSTPGCTFAEHIRSVHAVRQEWSLNNPVFDEIAAGLGGVLELNLSLDCQANAHAFYCTGFIASFPHVARLTLTFDIRPDRVPLLEIISLFPAFGHISLDPPSGVVPPRGMRRIGISTRDLVGPILAWLMKSNHLPNMDCVVLPMLRHTDIPTVRLSMQQLGPALRHLSIDLSWLLPDVDPETIFDLALHPHLETLSIYDWPSPSIDFDPNALFRLVTRLPASNLERISLEIDLDVLYYQQLDWAAFAAFFSATRFPSLRSITVKCCRHSNHGDNDHEFLRASLSLLLASGMLRTEW
ncbi:hypothetical protein DFH08DRAFT_1015176 [Mycena albidolilacea]|uniref:F-box domain-containing protein n=1 Tax=Mycena albidolilacea TaxID=1033008 RepID=A0AAD7AP03_9AGAR|nr:hypothetical protein DFH08DRAFT_1015176 [Mycena albidolilacea]